jgi:hypothetical protein
MDARYKGIRTMISAALAIALTGVLLWGILDAGAAAAWMGAQVAR